MLTANWFLPKLRLLTWNIRSHLYIFQLNNPHTNSTAIQTEVSVFQYHSDSPECGCGIYGVENNKYLRGADGGRWIR